MMGQDIIRRTKTHTFSTNLTLVMREKWKRTGNRKPGNNKDDHDPREAREGENKRDSKYYDMQSHE